MTGSEKSSLFKLILAALLYSAVPVLEIFVFLWIGDLIGVYLAIAAAALAGLPGIIVAMGRMRKTRDALKAKIRSGEYPVRELADAAGIIVSAVLLLTPGFITDCAAYLLLVPPLRRALERFLSRVMESRYKEVYRYLRLKDLR